MSIDTEVPPARSKLMASVRSKDTKPELELRRGLHRLGYRFRLHRKDLPGRPDIVFPKHRAVIFVNGCFWHRHHGCSKATTPKTRVEFWSTKFEQNVARDQRNICNLEAAGWRVLVVWECEIKEIDRVLNEVRRVLRPPSDDQSVNPLHLGFDRE